MSQTISSYGTGPYRVSEYVEIADRDFAGTASERHDCYFVDHGEAMKYYRAHPSWVDHRCCPAIRHRFVINRALAAAARPSSPKS